MYRIIISVCYLCNAFVNKHLSVLLYFHIKENGLLSTWWQTPLLTARVQVLSCQNVSVPLLSQIWCLKNVNTKGQIQKKHRIHPVPLKWMRSCQRTRTSAKKIHHCNITWALRESKAALWEMKHRGF